MIKPMAITIIWSLMIWPSLSVAQSKYDEPEITQNDRSHWAFVPPKRANVPSFSKHPVDAFLLEKLQTQNLKYSKEADRHTLIIRLSLDLLGLPPSLEEISQFEKDKSPDAYEILVDRLLASQHFGEKQAQHWLDVVRFAESNGYELDGDRPNAWQYRDYVVKSFNTDKSYFDFVKEQIAGDELNIGRDGLIATGFHRCGPVHVVSGNLDRKVVRQEVLTEMVTGVGSAILGLTLGCARCHDHKFDPLSAGDYYRIEAYFAGTRFKDYELASDDEMKAFKKKSADIKAKTEPIRKAIGDIDRPIRDQLKTEKTKSLDSKTQEALAIAADKRSAAQKKLVKDAEGVLTVRWDEILERLSKNEKAKRDLLRAELFKLEELLPNPLPQAWGVESDDQPPATFILKRGDLNKRTLQVAPQPIRVITPINAKIGSTRSDLANWLVDSNHPLTARVIVNRIWQQHFGKGIVDTPNDFGTRGGKPSHPALLDWLAFELTSGRKPGSLKAIHKLIVMSQAYRQESHLPLESDPENRLLSRMSRLRLDAESIRDRMLAASGQLNRQQGGVSVRVPLEPEVYDLIFTEDEPDHLWRITPDERQHTRRSLYLYAKRNVRYPMLEAFDQPYGINSCAVRGRSLFAPQALITMNGSFARNQSDALAKRISKTNAVNQVFETVLLRSPTHDERNQCQQFLKSEGSIEELCLAILNLNEFAYRP